MNCMPSMCPSLLLLKWFWPLLMNQMKRTYVKLMCLTTMYWEHEERREVRRFLCFTTGSSVLIANRISVTFNNLSGLARKPIAHTCGCVIELPSTYMSFLDFEQEFTAILAEDEYIQLASACSISHLSLFSILMLFIRLIITVLI